MHQDWSVYLTPETISTILFDVDDSYEYDVLGAKISGMLACWFTCQDSSYHVSGILPDMKIESLWELPALMNQSM